MGVDGNTKPGLGKPAFPHLLIDALDRLSYNPYCTRLVAVRFSVFPDYMLSGIRRGEKLIKIILG